MNDRRELKEAIQRIAGTFLTDWASVVSATIVSVDEEHQTCVVTPVGGVSTTSIENVQLSAEENDGFVLIPAVGSTVLVAITKNNEPFILLYSDIDKVIIIAGVSVQFNDGSFNGMVKVDALTSRLNALENLINDVITKYNAHTHLDPISGSTSSTSVPESSTATTTNADDIQNSKITHGI